MIGQLISVVLQASSAFPSGEPWDDSPVVQLAAPWDGLEIGQWHYLGSSNGNQSVTFLRPGPRRGLVWSRHEHLAPTARLQARSIRVLFEVDCSEWKTRTMQLVAFDAANLKGNQVEQRGQGAWEYAGPDTIAESVLNYGCGD